jgi:dipeptidyl aminopeptidase/acylaminoacyl peptidase
LESFMPRKLTFDDLWNFKDWGDIAVSPDGRQVALVLHSMDKAKDERRSAIWLLHFDEQGHALGEPRQLTSGVKNDTHPVWAPDNKRLLFLSDREEEKNQLWLIDADGGEARKLTNMLNGVSEAAWSPDGQWIAFTAMVAPTDDDEVLMGRKSLTPDEKKKREEEERIRLRTITTIWYRLDGRGLFDKFNQLFVMPAPSTDAEARFSASDPATIRRLTSGDFDHNQPVWTPDSSEIGILCNRSEDRDRSFVTDLWAINHETGEARRISNGTLEIACYSWSPDGREVILVGAQDLRIEGTSNVMLYLVSRDGGDIEKLTADIDNSTFTAASTGFGWPAPYRPQWSEDRQRIYFLVTEHACINVYRLDMAQRRSTPLTTGEHLVYFLALLPNEQGLLLAEQQSLHPWELELLPLSATGTEVGRLSPLTHIYDRQLAEFAWSKPERILYQGANHDEVEGWLMLPIGAKEGVRYPLVVRIHGGPQWAFGMGMNLYHQYLAAQGFAVFYCNPHGSTSYGQAFMHEVEGDWGGWDYQDIMRGVDECIARGVADPERLVVSGYSYGGYMSMFIIGRTDRFKAAVPMAGVSNLSSFVGTSDLGFWQTAQSKGYPWDPERAEYYRERSPLTHAGRVTTPTLFLHPENDLRCPIEQSEQFYMTLKMMGKVPVEFVRAPAAFHAGTSKPSQYLAYWEKMLEWFHKYVEIRPEEYQ